jgi:hypothetical protein
MTSTLTTIADTIAAELSRAVEAAESATNAGLDLVKQKIGTAMKRRIDGLERAAELEREAGRLIAESLKVREEVEQTFAGEMLDASSAIDTLKTDRVKVPRSSRKSIAAPKDHADA